MSPHILMALQVCADEHGFINVNAALRRSGVRVEMFRRELCSLIHRDIVRGANSTCGVAGVLPESGLQLAEGWR